MVLVRNWPFFHFIILGLVGKENVFYDILERKNPFLGYKNKKLKKSKNEDFSKGVRPWFLSEINNMSIFFILALVGQENVFHSPGKCVHDILEPQKAFLS